MSDHMKRTSRRGFLKVGLVGASAALLAACQAKVVEVTKIVPVEKVVKETVPVEKTVKETVVIEIYDGPHYPQKPDWYSDERDAH